MMNCPVCARPCISPAGRDLMGILVVGDRPGRREIEEGRPFVGLTGTILRAEMRRAGLILDNCLYTNLWLHEVTDSMWQDDAHLVWHLLQVIKLTKTHEHLLFLGTNISKIAVGENISGIVGLELPLLSPPFPEGRVATVGPNPASLLHGTLGEFRLTIQKFAKRCRGEQL